jgi:hypothetical protein
MMRIKIVFLTILIGFSCIKNKNSGYNCENGNCVASFDNPTYLNLQDCKSLCGGSIIPPNSTKPGAVTITLNWDIHRKCDLNDWYPCWDVLVGLGYNQSDVNNESYFNHKDLSAPGSYTVTNLTPGAYYYGAKKTIRSNCYQAGTQFCGIIAPTTKSGSFQVKSDITTSVTASL